MLTNAGQREIVGCWLFPDDSDPLRWYKLPQAPRIAIDADTKKPIFSLVWYRRDVSQLTDDERKTRLGGGILAASFELSNTDDEMKQIRAGLAADTELQHRTKLDKDKLAAALLINTIPITDGTVSVAILGENPDPTAKGTPGEFVNTLVGVGRASMTGDERAAFMAKLTQDGVVLLWNMLEKNLSSILVTYDLKYSYRAEGFEMSVWCHGRKVYDALQQQWASAQESGSFSDTHDGNNETLTSGHGASNSASDRLSTAFSSSEYSGVNITEGDGAAALKPELIEQLTQQGSDMIKDYLTSTFLEQKVGDDFKPDDQQDIKTELATYEGKKYGSDDIRNYKLKDYSESVIVDLAYHATANMVLEAHLGPQGMLSTSLTGTDLESLRTRVDIDASFYKYLDVHLVCTANFDDDPISLVKAHLSYQGSGPDGEINSVGDFVFQKGSAPQRFSTYLGQPDQLTYAYQYEVYYKGGTDKVSISGHSNETILVLDVDHLGILRVDFQTGIVDWDHVQQVLIKASYGSGATARQTEFTLDAQHTTHRWTEVVAREVTEPYSWQASYVDKGGQRIETDPVTQRGPTVIVNQPLQDSMTVVLVSAGSFGAAGLISQVVVATRYNDARNNYEQHQVFTLAKEGDSKTWSFPLVDKNFRTYDYKVTVFYSDGVTREDVWRTTTNEVLPVGDPFGFRLEILPYLLRGATWAFGTINLTFDDADAQIHAEKTLEIKDFTTPLTWRFRLGSVDRHTYKYQLTLYRAADGKQFDVPMAEESKEVLVLIPPPQS